MIKITNVKTYGWEAAIRGMRNPKNSWENMDSSFFTYPDYNEGFPHALGKNDLKLAHTLADAGTDHGKFLRMIVVNCDITAPLYWWKEFDTYKVGTVANSCSTMHKIHAKEFEMDDFSHEHLLGTFAEDLNNTVARLNTARTMYLDTGSKNFWWQMIQLLPSSYNQLRTVQMNYAVLRNIYHARKNHKLDEWHAFCDLIEGLPYSELITGAKQWEEEEAYFR